MQYYVIGLMIVQLVSFGIFLGDPDAQTVSSAVRFIGHVVQAVLFLPLYGRILGWW